MKLVQAVYADKEMSLDKINAMIAIVEQSESQKEARTIILFKCEFLKYYDSWPADYRKTRSGVTRSELNNGHIS